LYSLLSSNLSILIPNAPAEAPPPTTQDTNGISLTIHNADGGESSPSMLGFDMYNSSPTSMSPSTSFFVDYYQKQRAVKLNLNVLDDDELVLSKPLLQDCRILIQLRLEMIALYVCCILLYV
jgi:hypothetical protein